MSCPLFGGQASLLGDRVLDSSNSAYYFFPPNATAIKNKLDAKTINSHPRRKNRPQRFMKKKFCPNFARCLTKEDPPSHRGRSLFFFSLPNPEKSDSKSMVFIRGKPPPPAFFFASQLDKCRPLSFCARATFSPPARGPRLFKHRAGPVMQKKLHRFMATLLHRVFGSADRSGADRTSDRAGAARQ